MKNTLMMAVAVCLVGCAPQIQSKWVRYDEQLIHSSPQLEQQFQVDTTVCDGEIQKANLSGTQLCRGLVDCAAQGAQRRLTVGKGCMAQKGYALIPEDQVDAKLAEFRAAQVKPVATASAKR